jgi:crotonobetainyl-CoA:carnitine CoA-transferase CaiB-like acyl-CoA transferase
VNTTLEYIKKNLGYLKKNYEGFHLKGSFRKRYGMNAGILNGIRIIDFTRVLAGPYATRVLADFGAEVIKVQSKKTTTGAESNTGIFFSMWNRNKRSITLDMSYPEARELALKMVAISDVVIENFTPRVIANWGLHYEKLTEVKAELIMLSMSGMGQTGPWKDHVAFGPTVQSLGGLTYLTSYEENSPVGAGYAHADHVSGLYGALAVLAALDYRDRTGRGQYIDLSEYEAVATLIGPALIDAFTNDTEVLPKGNRSDYLMAAPYGCYPCLGTDRWCVIAVFNEVEWKALCQVLGQPVWTKEEKFCSISKREEHAEELDILLSEWTSERSAEEIVVLLQKAGVSAGVVQNAEDLANDPQLLEREFFVHLKHPTLGDTISDGSPIRFGHNDAKDWKASPLMGEHNEYVFMNLLGLSESEFLTYVDMGVIG